ncbi:MAG: NHL repeat-containing protein [Nocardioides sp.]
MRVTVVPPGTPPGAAQPGGSRGPLPPATYAGWRPRAVLGAPAPGGLLLPLAQPTAAWMYGPRGVLLDDGLVVAADTGNHRVLLWYSVPDRDGAPADVVLGQPDEHSEGPAAGGRGPEHGMHLPTGLVRDGDRLLVADAWHHRLLVWDSLPTETGTPPDHVLGQSDLRACEPNAGAEPDAGSFYWPFGASLVDGRLYVADTGNRRVLVWRDGIPEGGQPADVVLGQPDGSAREENRGGPVAADSFRWPHAFAGDGAGGVWVADAGNHRLLGWRAHPDEDRPADLVLGQPDFETGTEFPYVPQERRLRFPYAVAAVGADLAIADTANNRVLVQHGPVACLDPDVALAQPDLVANGENRWAEVAADTLCWPYGLAWHRTSDGGDLLAVADSGNNRVVLWERS